MSVPTECCFPHCYAEPTRKAKLPLCDRHMVKVYREVHALTELPLVRHSAVEGIVVDGDAIRNRPGLVYFIQFADRVKIGFTTDLATRLNHLPHDRILATMPGSFSDEQRLHRTFEHLNVRGEWFSMGDDLMDYIAQVQAAA